MSGPLEPLRRWRPLVLSMAVASVIGCDDLTVGDKSTLGKVDAALTQLAPLETLEPGGGIQTVTGGLAQAADGAAGPAYKAIAAGAVASVDQQSAYAGMLTLKKQQTAIRRTLVNLQGLAGQVASSHAYATGYSLGDPKAAVGDLSSHISSMQGNAQNLTWGFGEKPQLPTLAAVKQEAARLDGEIEQKQQQLDAMTKQRDEAAATAAVQLQHAEGLKGEEGVRAFAEASESRRRAEDLLTSIDLVQVQIDRLKSDLTLTKAQGGIVDTGITALHEQGKLLESDWATQQNFGLKQKAVATLALNGEKTGDYSMKAVLDTLTTQLAEHATTRSAVLEQLQEGRKYAESARDQATQFAQSISTKLQLPGKASEPYRNFALTVNPQHYQYRLGVAQRDTGALSMSEAGLLMEVKSTLDAARSTVSAAGLTAPEALEKIDVSLADQLAKDAEARLSEAAETLVNVESGTSPEPLKAAAKAARLVTLNAHLGLYAMRQAAGDTGAAGASAQMLTDAKALRDEIAATNTPLPPLPGELGTAPPAPAPTPDGAAPPAEPAAGAPAGAP